MKGIISKALVVTLLFSYMNNASAMYVIRGVQALAPYLAQGKQLVLKGAQIARKNAITGAQGARQAVQPVLAKVSAGVAKYPEHTVLGGFVAATGVGVTVAKQVADKKTAATVVKPGTFTCVKAYSQCALNSAVQYFEKTGSWFASTRVAQSMRAHPAVWAAGAVASVCLAYNAMRKKARCNCCAKLGAEKNNQESRENSAP